MSPLAGSVTTTVGSVRASGGFPLTPGFPSVIRTLPSGLNLTTTLPFLSSPGKFLSSSVLARLSPTHFPLDRHGCHAATRTSRRQSSRSPSLNHQNGGQGSPLSRG